MKFSIVNSWDFQGDFIDVDLFSLHYEKNYVFWITLFGIAFVWESDKMNLT